MASAISCTSSVPSPSHERWRSSWGDTPIGGNGLEASERPSGSRSVAAVSRSTPPGQDVGPKRSVRIRCGVEAGLEQQAATAVSTNPLDPQTKAVPELVYAGGREQRRVDAARCARSSLPAARG